MTIRITFDTSTIDLLMGPEGLQTRYIGSGRKQQRSKSGRPETLIENISIECELDAYFEDDTYYDLLAWWSWASQGKAWTLAMDTNDTVHTTLDGSAGAGQAVIPLTVTTGLSVGDVCLIRSGNGLNFEIVTLQSISAGVSVTADANLKFSYSANDQFRHEHFFPIVVSLDDVFEPNQRGNIWRHQFRFLDVSLLRFTLTISKNESISVTDNGSVTIA